MRAPIRAPAAPCRIAAATFSSLALFPLLGACGAAGSGSVGSGGPGSTTRIYGVAEQEIGSGGVNVQTVGDASRRELASPPDVVWPLIRAAYQELGIPVSEVREPSRTLVTEGVRVSRIGGERMSRFVDCGRGATGNRADSYDVLLTLTTSVLPADGGGSALLVRSDAWARPRSRSAPAVHCSFTGRLSSLIVERLEAGTEGAGSAR